MSPSGKSVFNPFALNQSSTAAESQPAEHHGMDKPLRPDMLRDRKGISLVGTVDRLARMSMQQATVFSITAHVLGPVLLTIASLLVLLILSWLLHFNFWDLFKAKAPPQDLEFTLVAEAKVPKPEKALFKGNANQRAGGKQNRKQPIKAVEQPPQASASRQAKAPEPKPQAAQKSTPQTPPKPVQKQAQKQESKPVKPSMAPTIPTSKAPEPRDEMAMDIKQRSATATQSGATQIASTGDLTSGINAHSNLSNPQDGKVDTPGVDVEEDADFGPFMADLERRIKRNWLPPRGRESRKVALLFYLNRDGRIIKIETKTSSGDVEADRAAIAAVEASAPFMAFPPQVKEDVLPVEFTFDYNVLNPKNPKQALKW